MTEREATEILTIDDTDEPCGECRDGDKPCDRTGGCQDSKPEGCDWCHEGYVMCDCVMS